MNPEIPYNLTVLKTQVVTFYFQKKMKNNNKSKNKQMLNLLITKFYVLKILLVSYKTPKNNMLNLYKMIKLKFLVKMKKINFPNFLNSIYTVEIVKFLETNKQENLKIIFLNTISTGKTIYMNT